MIMTKGGDRLAAALGTMALLSFAAEAHANVCLEANMTASGLSSSLGLSTIADFDGDGDLDLAAVSRTTASFTLIKGDGAGAFSSGGVTLASGAKFSDIVSGDMDGDGDVDIVTSAFISSGDVRIFGNDGSGSFTVGASNPACQNARALDVGDVDGDGELDVVVTCAWTAPFTVMLLKNTGGALSPAMTVATTGANPTDIELADMDSDGDLDLVVANEDDDTVGIYPNLGGGTFGSGTLITTGDDPTSLAVAHLDADGFLDIVVGTGDFGTAAGTLEVILNDGSGFTSYVASTAPSAYMYVTTGDVNGDGATDVIASIDFGATGVIQAEVYHGDGLGGLTLTSVHPTPSTPGWLGLLDYDSDGDDDLVANIDNKGTMVKYDNDGSGTFAEPPIVPLGLGALGPDLNGDGIGDYTGTSYVTNPYATFTRDVTVQLSMGPGVWGPPTTYPTFNSIISITPYDVDEDGDLDLFVPTSGVGDVGPVFGAGITMLINQGDGTFIVDAVKFPPNFYISTASLGHFTTNGNLGMLVTGTTPSIVPFAYIREHLGNFQFSTRTFIPIPAIQGAVVQDLDGDGLDELVVNTSFPAMIRVFKTDGNYGFSEVFSTAAGTNERVQFGDVTSDGLADLVTLDVSAHTISVYPGLPGTTFGSPTTVATGPSVLSLFLLHMNGDCLLDAVTTSPFSSEVGVYENLGGGAFAPATTYHAPGGSPSSVTIGDLDLDGQPELAAIHTNSLAATLLPFCAGSEPAVCP